MKLTEEQAKDLLWGDHEDDFKVEEESEWTHEHKFQHKEVIFVYGGKFYELNVSRSGSEWTDWYYDFTLDCPEVEKREVTTHI